MKGPLKDGGDGFAVADAQCFEDRTAQVRTGQDRTAVPSAHRPLPLLKKGQTDPLKGLYSPFKRNIRENQGIM